MAVHLPAMNITVTFAPIQHVYSNNFIHTSVFIADKCNSIMDKAMSFNLYTASTDQVPFGILLEILLFSFVFH